MAIMIMIIMMIIMGAHLVRRLSGIVEPLLVGPAEEQHASTAVLFGADCHGDDDDCHGDGDDDEDGDVVDDDDGDDGDDQST